MKKELYRKSMTKKNVHDNKSRPTIQKINDKENVHDDKSRQTVQKINCARWFRRSPQFKSASSTLKMCLIEKNIIFYVVLLYFCNLYTIAVVML